MGIYAVLEVGKSVHIPAREWRISGQLFCYKPAIA
jgi:hypothetical protein